MDVGEPQREIIVEPIENPVRETPAESPPVETPEQVPA
jgi:hypothetical protein